MCTNKGSVSSKTSVLVLVVCLDPLPFVGFSRGSWGKIPYKGDPVHHDLGGERVTLLHEYAIYFINIHKNVDTYSKSLLLFEIFALFSFIKLTSAKKMSCVCMWFIMTCIWHTWSLYNIYVFNLIYNTYVLFITRNMFRKIWWWNMLVISFT